MPNVSMKSQCVRTIRVHVLDRSDFMLPDANVSSNQFYLVEFAKSAGCDFFCNRLAFKKKSFNHKYRSNQENDTKLCWMVC